MRKYQHFPIAYWKEKIVNAFKLKPVMNQKELAKRIGCSQSSLGCSRNNANEAMGYLLADGIITKENTLKAYIFTKGPNFALFVPEPYVIKPKEYQKKKPTILDKEEIKGRILDTLLETGLTTKWNLSKVMGFHPGTLSNKFTQVSRVFKELIKAGMIRENNELKHSRYYLDGMHTPSEKSEPAPAYFSKDTKHAHNYSEQEFLSYIQSFIRVNFQRMNKDNAEKLDKIEGELNYYKALAERQAKEMEGLKNKPAFSLFSWKTENPASEQP